MTSIKQCTSSIIAAQIDLTCILLTNMTIFKNLFNIVSGKVKE